MAAALFNLVYLWLMISSLDPAGFAGLTQRVATVVIFGWYALASYGVLVSVVRCMRRPEFSSYGTTRCMTP